MVRDPCGLWVFSPTLGVFSVAPGRAPSSRANIPRCRTTTNCAMNKIRRNTASIPGFGVDRACCAREIPLSTSASETLACQLVISRSVYRHSIRRCHFAKGLKSTVPVGQYHWYSRAHHNCTCDLTASAQSRAHSHNAPRSYSTKIQDFQFTSVSLCVPSGEG